VPNTLPLLRAQVQELETMTGRQRIAHFRRYRDFRAIPGKSEHELYALADWQDLTAGGAT